MTDNLEAEVARLKKELDKRDETIKRKTELVHRLILPTDSAQVQLALAIDELEFAKEDLRKSGEREHEYAKALIKQGSAYRIIFAGALVIGIITGYALRTIYDLKNSHTPAIVIEQPK